jgi:sugar lactone lactonase YvrE
MRRILTVVLFLTQPGWACAQDMNLSQILVDGAGWMPVSRVFRTIAGLAGDRDGNLYVAEADGRVVRIGKDGSAEALKQEFDAIRDISMAGNGVLTLALGGKKGAEDDSRIAQLNLANNELTETRVRGVRDVAATRKGAIYFTVPAEKGVFLLNASGGSRKVVAGIDAPAGLTLSPDQGTLIVGDADD